MEMDMVRISLWIIPAVNDDFVSQTDGRMSINLSWQLHMILIKQTDHDSNLNK